MDQKHREYCIRLGNPFMQEDKINNREPFQQEQLSNNWVDETNMDDDSWLKNSQKFTD